MRESCRLYGGHWMYHGEFVHAVVLLIVGMKRIDHGSSRGRHCVAQPNDGGFGASSPIRGRGTLLAGVWRIRAGHADA